MCDYDALKCEYITTDISMPKLAKKHNVPLTTMQKRCKKEGWVALRKEFKKEALSATLDTAVANEADRLGKIIASAQAMAGVIEDVFKDGKQFHRHLVTDTYIGEDGSKEILTVEKQFDKVDSRAIRDLTGALKDMTLVLRNLYNLPTQAEAEAQRIASERLKLEQRKAEADSNGEGKRIEVVLADGWDALAK
jgi:hypothetical protein